MAPAPPKQYLPLILFIWISLFFVFLFSISASNRKPGCQSELTRVPSPKTGVGFTFVIKVLTFDRPSSLVRCLNSLSRAHYDAGDRIHLHVFIDHFRGDSETPSADTDRSLSVSREILEFVDGFSWGFGEKVVHYRTSNAGLQAQWIESWWPSSDHEFAFVVEDDLEVSPLYYRFLKAIILNYYYNSSNFSPFVYGASLQRPRFVPGKHGNKMKLDGEQQIFLYQLVGTWGQLLFPRPWKEFRLWYDVHKAKNMKPFLEGMVTNGWYKKLGEKIWTPWFIKFVHSHGYFNFYTNFQNQRALSVSHRDAGVNYGKTAGPDSDLVDETETSADSKLLKLPALSSLKWYDFCFSEILSNRIIRSSKDLQSGLQTMKKDNYVVLVSVYRGNEKIVRNTLCLFERLNIQNYILIGPSSDFLLDLARRGHPVIDASEFSDSMSVNSQDELIKENVVMALAIRKSLELGYTTWLLDGHSVPLSDDSFSAGYDFDVGRSTGLLSVRSSQSVLKIWSDDFIYKIASQIHSVKGDSSSLDRPLFSAVVKLLNEQKEKIKLGDIDGIDLGSWIAANVTESPKSKFLFWSDETDVDALQKQLEHLGLWVVDGEYSCTAVLCHQS